MKISTQRTEKKQTNNLTCYVIYFIPQFETKNKKITKLTIS